MWTPNNVFIKAQPTFIEKPQKPYEFGFLRFSFCTFISHAFASCTMNASFHGEHFLWVSFCHQMIKLINFVRIPFSVFFFFFFLLSGIRTAETNTSLNSKRAKMSESKLTVTECKQWIYVCQWIYPNITD